MKKTAQPVRKPVTHFEQIPVAAVKKLAVTPKARVPVKLVTGSKGENGAGSD